MYVHVCVYSCMYVQSIYVCLRMYVCIYVQSTYVSVCRHICKDYVEININTVFLRCFASADAAQLSDSLSQSGFVN